MEHRFRASYIVTGVILSVLLLTGPLVGVDIVEPTNEPLGDGTANVTVLEPDRQQLRVTAGRFDTRVWYVRLPDAVVDVSDLDGQPRVVYVIAIPGLDVEKRAKQTVTREGRVRLPLTDRALESRPSKNRYTGYLEVRVQSFTGQSVVVNRTVEVVVE